MEKKDKQTGCSEASGFGTYKPTTRFGNANAIQSFGFGKNKPSNSRFNNTRFGGSVTTQFEQESFDRQRFGTTYSSPKGN